MLWRWFPSNAERLYTWPSLCTSSARPQMMQWPLIPSTAWNTPPPCSSHFSWDYALPPPCISPLSSPHPLPSLQLEFKPDTHCPMEFNCFPLSCLLLCVACICMQWWNVCLRLRSMCLSAEIWIRMAWVIDYWILWLIICHLHRSFSLQADAVWRINGEGRYWRMPRRHC